MPRRPATGRAKPEDALEKKLRDERRTIDTLNSMLAANGCAVVDIEAELKKPAKPVPPSAHAEKLHFHHKTP